jgi:LEA14-like dessication related protein
MLKLAHFFGPKNYSPTLQSKSRMRRLLIAVAIVATIASCTKPKDLEFVDIQNLRMIKWGFNESLVGLDVRFYNPNNQQVQLKDAEAKVYVNSTYLGDTRMDSIVGVPRRDTFSIPLTLKVKTVSTFSKVMESLTDSTINIKVDGSVKMGKGGLFITYPIKYEKQQSVAELTSHAGF